MKGMNSPVKEELRKSVRRSTIKLSNAAKSTMNIDANMLKHMTAEQQAEIIRQVLENDKAVSEYIEYTKGSLVKTIDQIVNTQMEVEDIKDRAILHKEQIDKKMEDVFNENKVSNSDKYHKYKF